MKGPADLASQEFTKSLSSGFSAIFFFEEVIVNLAFKKSNY